MRASFSPFDSFNDPPKSKSIPGAVVAVSFAGLLAGAAYYLAMQPDHVTVQRRAGSTLQVNLVQQSGSASRADFVAKPAASVADQPAAPAEVSSRVADSMPDVAEQASTVMQMDSRSSSDDSPSSQAMAAPLGRSADLAAVNSSFQRELLAHIASYRRYPDAARSGRLSGVVNVRFALDRDGMVLDAWVQKSSGFDALDQEALETIRRAQPMPSIPPSMPGRVDLVMPVAFALL